jgi:luciferase family oxidoreductase group 1
MSLGKLGEGKHGRVPGHVATINVQTAHFKRSLQVRTNSRRPGATRTIPAPSPRRTTFMRLNLSVLDQSAAIAGRSEAESIRDTLALASHCEALGYRRFWVSEHHNIPAIVGTAPEVLMAAIAATTSRIRIGSAGVMLPHYSALKVAEQFRVLEALAPGRIDLGLGRAPGGDMRTARALNPNADGAAEDFPQQVRDLQAWVCAREGEAHVGIHAHPHGPTSPELWILGSSDYGAQLAAHFGLPYAFAYFFTDGQGAEQAMALYRQLYKPSARFPAPMSTLCVWALAADSEDEARHHALSRDRWRVDRQRGVFGPLRAPDEVAAQGFAPADEPTLQAMRKRAFVGTAAQVGAKLRALAAAFELDELVINTWAHDPAVRRRSYALLAQQFELRAAVS